MRAHGRRGVFHSCVASFCILALVPGETVAYAYSQSPAPAASGDSIHQIPPDQLDSLVAPIALYPDPLLAQVLAASTYPLEIIQLQQWLNKNKGLKDKALADAVAKAALGSQRPGTGRPARCGEASRRRYRDGPPTSEMRSSPSRPT